MKVYHHELIFLNLLRDASSPDFRITLSLLVMRNKKCII